MQEGGIMTTVHHPSHMGVRWHPDRNWLWVAISIVVVALITFTIAWIVTQPVATPTSEVQSISGFEHSHEATPMHLTDAGITTNYAGYSGELYPAITVLQAAEGFAYDHEVTPIRFTDTGITTNYVGYSGELYPER
jgi:hypothetical protein